MSQTTSVDSLFSRQEKGKFLNEEELKQIQQDLSYLIDENKTLSKKIEYYQKTIGTGQSLVPDQLHDQTIVHEKKIIEQEKNALEQEKYAIEQHRLALEKHRQLLEQQRQGVEQEKQLMEKQKHELEQRSGELEKQRETYSNSPESHYSEHVMSIDVQLIYFMLFIILLILILKK